MKKFITLFSIVLAVSFAAQAQLMVKTAAAPAIDGVIDAGEAWADDAWVSQDSVKGDTEDMSSMFQVIHDNDKIYLAAKVVDATPANAGIGASYERDCLETFWSFKSSDLDFGDYGDGDWQLRCQRDDADGNFIDGSTGWDADGFLDNVEYGVVSDDDGYVIEMSFNIAGLAGDSDFDGMNFRMDIATADNTTAADGGRTQQVFWNSASDLQWNNTTYFGAAQFETAIGVAEEAANAISAYVSGNELVVSNASGLVSVYNVAGQLMTSTVVNGNGSINISALNSGLYIVKNNDFSVKVMK